MLAKDDIKKKAFNGVLSIGASKVAQQFLAIFITGILATLLNPNEFGLVGIVTIFTGFFSVFSSLGLGSAIVQNQNITNNQLSTIFWTNIAFGFLFFLLLTFLSKPISQFYSEPKLRNLTVVLAVNFLLGPLFMIPRKLIEKNLKFTLMAVLSTTSILISGLGGIIAALSGMGAWSLVIQSLVLNISYLVFYNYFNFWVPAISFVFKETRNLFKFGIKMMGTNFTGYVESNIDYILISKLLGPTALGFYTLAFRIMLLPIRQVSYIFTDVLFPVFSKIQNNFNEVKTGYLRSIRYTSFITFPLMAFAFILSGELIPVALGEKWLESVVLIKILCAAGAIQSIEVIAWSVFPALNKPDIRLKLGFLSTIIFGLSITVGSKWGISGVAYAVLISRCFMFLITQIFMNSLLDIKFREIISTVFIPTSGSIIILFSFPIYNLFLNVQTPYSPRILFTLVFFNITVYTFYLYSFAKHDLRYILDLLKTR